MRRRASFLLASCAAIVASAASCTSLLGDFVVTQQVMEGGIPTDTGAFDATPVRDSGAAEAPATAEAGAAVQALTSDVSVYVGQTATVDASGSTTTQGTLTFSWTIVAAPGGSGVTTKSLAGAASARASFVPDVPGDYVLMISVKANGRTSGAQAKVTAATPQVLFAQGMTNDAGQESAYYTMADVDGGNAHAVLCPDLPPDASARIAAFAGSAGRAYDFWEGKPGQPLRFAAFTFDQIPEAGVFTHLWAGSGASSCAAPAVDFGTAFFGPGRPFGSEPHLNPSGSRFVVFDRQWQILTYAIDGGAPQVIAEYPVPYVQARSVLDPVGFDGGGAVVVEPPRVEWTANGLAWAQPTANGWQIVSAPDGADGGQPTQYMSCKGVTPREIAMLSDGTVIASYRLTPQSSENLYQLKPDARQNCTAEQQYTNLPNDGASAATDFAVSPDGTQIAFLEINTKLHDISPWTQGGAQLPGGYLYVVPVAGGTPTLLSTEPAIFGPRWIGGGTALVFTRLDGMAASTGRPATSVVVIGADGGAERIVAQGDGVSTFVSTSGSAGCSVGAGVARPGGAGIWAMAAAATGLARRRGRRG
jgi:hypothetical protein